MGCRGTQSLVVLLSLFNFVSLVLSGALLFVTVVVSIGIRKGLFEVAHIFTYNAFVINKFMQATNILGHGFNVAVGVYVAMAISILAIITALFGFIMLCCRCGGSPKAAKAYNTLVTINTIFHLAVIIACVVLLRNVKGSVTPAMEKLQNDIRVDIIDDLGSMELNRDGELFQMIQDEYMCCGVRNGSEWMNVEWFRNKYLFTSTKSQKPLSFPCTDFSEIAPLLQPCGPLPQPDCTAARPVTQYGCAEPLEENIFSSIKAFTYVFGVICIVQVIGLILASIYSNRVCRRSGSFTFRNTAIRNTSARVSCTSTHQRLMPQYPDGGSNILTMETDELQRMCYEIIAKNSTKSADKF